MVSILSIYSKWISVDLLWCWYKWGEYSIIGGCKHTHSYNFRFLFICLEHSLFFINSITLQFVWRDVDDFFFLYFFQFPILKLKYLHILHMFHRLAKHRNSQAATASIDAINRLKNLRYSESAFTFSLCGSSTLTVHSFQSLAYEIYRSSYPLI